MSESIDIVFEEISLTLEVNENNIDLEFETSVSPNASGDMLKSVYDQNNNNIVDLAEDAQRLGGQPASVYLQDLNDVLSRGNSAGGQNIEDVNELIAVIVRGLAELQLIAGTDLSLSAGNIASVLGPTIASLISNEGQVVIDGDRITVQHSGEVRFSASLIDLLGTTRVRNLPAAVNSDEPVRKQEYDAALANKADLVGGVIPTSQIPTIAITEFLGAVANQAAMLLLTGERGDWCIRQDVSMAYVLIAEDATLIANWVAIPHPQSPVLSVNGQTGVIILSTSNIGEGSNLYWTQTRFDNAFAAKTTDGLTEGATNLYFTNARVLATTLVGLDTSTNAVITSGDSVLIAFGKLQKQITDLTAVVSGKENAISAGTTSQYWRGDKSWQTLDKTAVGLSDVNNLSAATLLATYHALMWCGVRNLSGDAAGTWIAALQQNTRVLSGSLTTTPPAIINIRAADYPAVGSLTPKLRIRATLNTNKTAPTGTWRVALFAMTASGGTGAGVTYTIGAEVSGSTTNTLSAPSAATMHNLAGSDFALPADGYYVAAVVKTGTQATGAEVHTPIEIQIHYT